MVISNRDLIVILIVEMFSMFGQLIDDNVFHLRLCVVCTNILWILF